MRLVIDCDPGLDDALAIILALASPELQLEAVVTVTGNDAIETVTQNAEDLLEALGSDVPVVKGCERPRVGEARLGRTLWGGDGRLGLPKAKKGQSGQGIEAYGDFLASPSSALAAIGPLTNVATALASWGEEFRNIARFVVMGGAFGVSGVTAYAEFNIWADPHAAAEVFDSSLPIVLVPLNITHQMQLPMAVTATMQAAAGQGAAVAATLLPLAAKPGHPTSMHDACAIAWLLWPELFETKRGIVTVETSGERQGETVFSPRADGRHTVVTGIHKEALIARIVARLVSF